MLFEGEEDHKTLAHKFEVLKKYLDGGVTSAGTRFTPWEGGDLKYNNRKSGLSGNFATHDQCLWCMVPRSSLVSLTPFAARTFNSTRVLAHLPPLVDGDPQFPFTCECCSSTYATQAQVDAESLNSEQQKMFPTLHHGVMWQQGPATTTPFDRIVPCVLHMRLRFCCTLWDWCIAPSVIVKRPEVAALIMAMLQADGVNTNRLRKLNGFSDVLAIKNASFDGQGCDKVLARFGEYLEVSRSVHTDLG